MESQAPVSVGSIMVCCCCYGYFSAWHPALINRLELCWSKWEGRGGGTVYAWIWGAGCVICVDMRSGVYRIRSHKPWGRFSAQGVYCGIFWAQRSNFTRIWANEMASGMDVTILTSTFARCLCHEFLSILQHDENWQSYLHLNLFIYSFRKLMSDSVLCFK